MMRQKSWNQFKKTMAASTLAGAITFTGCAVMPSVTALQIQRNRPVRYRMIMR